MRTFIRFCIGTIAGIATGVMLLMIITGVAAGLGGTGDLFELFDAVGEGNLFAVAVLISIFILPIFAGMKTAFSEKRGMAEVIAIPLITGILTVIPIFLLGFIWAILCGIIGFFFGDDSVIGITMIIAAYIAFITPVFNIIGVIIVKD